MTFQFTLLEEAVLCVCPFGFPPTAGSATRHGRSTYDAIFDAHAREGSDAALTENQKDGGPVNDASRLSECRGFERFCPGCGRLRGHTNFFYRDSVMTPRSVFDVFGHHF